MDTVQSCCGELLLAIRSLARDKKLHRNEAKANTI